VKIQQQTKVVDSNSNRILIYQTRWLQKNNQRRLLG